jgi:serine/threonine protein kinase
MGALYLGVVGDEGLEKFCAIKTVLPHLADAEYVSRFRDEAKVVLRLQHGNIVSVFDAGQVDGELYMSMEFVDGRDLRAVWNRCAVKGIAFPMDVAVHIVREICRGLDHAHHVHPELKLVHRDVSPPNVMCAYSGEIKVADFGLATSTLKLEKTAPGVVFGKLSYMSPEQARGEPLDGRTDIYAAAIILWELLTGRQLFPYDPQTGVSDEAIASVRNPAIEPPSSRTGRVPKALDEIVMTGLAVNAAERYQTAEEFRVALAQFLAKEAPATDASRVKAFLSTLFDEDREAERREREALLRRLRELLKSGAGDGLGQGGARGGTSPQWLLAAPAPTPPRAARVVTEDDATDPRDPAAQQRERVSGTRAAVEPSGRARAASRDTTATADVEQGTLLDGRYRIVRTIGEGGMGRVYEAEHIEIGKRVAIKVLHAVYYRSPDVVERFRREARAASKIGHPNIVDVTDSGTTGGGATYFVMEYLEGIDLGALLSKLGTLSVPRALRVTQQICWAVGAAHEAGIIHRDLKPENVFLTSRNGVTDLVKVLDFGVAKSLDLERDEAPLSAAKGRDGRRAKLTRPGMTMGTPEYMAPEQAAGRPADPRADIYAIGAILFEMLSGRPPFSGNNFLEIITEKATREAPRVTTLRSEIAAPLDELIAATLARDPLRRPASVEVLEHQLAPMVEASGGDLDPVEAMALAGRRSGSRARLRITPPRRRAGPLLQGAVVALLAGGAVAGGAWVISRSGGGPRGAGPAAPGSAPDGGQTPGGRAGSPPDGDPASSPSGSTSATDTHVAPEGAAVEPSAVGAAQGRGPAGGHRVGPAPRPTTAAAPTAAGGGESAPSGSSPPSRDVERSATAGPVIPVGTSDGGAAGERGGAERPDDAAAGAKVDGGAKLAVVSPEPVVVVPPDGDDGRIANLDPVVAPRKHMGKSTRNSTEPDEASTKLLAEARAQLGARRYGAARELFTQVVNRSRPLRGQGYSGLAECAFEEQKFQEAVTTSRMAIAYGGGVKARMVLGDSYFRRREYAEAINEYEAVLSLAPDNAEAKRHREQARQRLQAVSKPAGGGSAQSTANPTSRSTATSTAPKR